MKSLLPLLFLLFLTNALHAQTDIQFTADSDTAFWYRYKNDIIEQFKLGYIENDTNAYSFRLWSFGLIVKVTNEGGEITRFAEASESNKSKRIFVKRYPVSSINAFQVRRLIDSLQIETLPSDKNIKGWKHGLDGITYFAEYKEGGYYSFKNYWTPTAQDSLNEAIRFQNFVSGVDKILNLKEISDCFQDDIPFESWTYPGSMTHVSRIKRRPKKNGD